VKVVFARRAVTARNAGAVGGGAHTAPDLTVFDIVFVERVMGERAVSKKEEGKTTETREKISENMQVRVHR
jgi:hypothetical protein